VADISLAVNFQQILLDGDLDIVEDTNFIVADLFITADDAIVFIDETSQIVFV
jgi:hypothetical protein